MLLTTLNSIKQCNIHDIRGTNVPYYKTYHTTDTVPVGLSLSLNSKY